MSTESNPLVYIKEYCLECAGSYRNVEECKPIHPCPLHPFRFGTNPYRKKKVATESQIVALSARHKKDGSDE